MVTPVQDLDPVQDGGVGGAGSWRDWAALTVIPPNLQKR